MSSRSKPLYFPAKDELTDAVVSYLKEFPDNKKLPSSPNITRSLQTENPTWKVSSKRVAKIVKQEKKKRNNVSSNNDDDDDDVSTTLSISSSSTASRARRMAGRMSSSMRHLLGTKSRSNSLKKGKSESSIIVVQDTNVSEMKLLPPVEEPLDSDPPESAPPEPEPVVEPATEPEIEPKPEEKVYAVEDSEIQEKPCFVFACAIQ